MLVLTEEQWRNSLAIQTLLSTPQKFGEAMKTAESAHGEESSMIALLSYGNTLAVQALLTSPEKIATAITIFSTHNLADSGMIRVLLTQGGQSVIRAFLEETQKLATALQTMACLLGVCSGLRFQVSLYCVSTEFIRLLSTLLLA